MITCETTHLYNFISFAMLWLIGHSVCMPNLHDLTLEIECVSFLLDLLISLSVQYVCVYMNGWKWHKHVIYFWKIESTISGLRITSHWIFFTVKWMGCIGQRWKKCFVNEVYEIWNQIEVDKFQILQFARYSLTLFAYLCQTNRFFFFFFIWFSYFRWIFNQLQFGSIHALNIQIHDFPGNFCCFFFFVSLQLMFVVCIAVQLS